MSPNESVLCFYIFKFFSFVLLKGEQNKYLMLFKVADFICCYDGNFTAQNSLYHERKHGWQIKKENHIDSFDPQNQNIFINFIHSKYLTLYKDIFLLSLHCS